jgi:hypothetical protein
LKCTSESVERLWFGSETYAFVSSLKGEVFCVFYIFLLLTGIFFFIVLEFELRVYTLSHFATLFCVGFFQDRVSGIICPSWIRTKILLISASWVARIIGVSHWCPARHIVL